MTNEEIAQNIGINNASHAWDQRDDASYGDHEECRQAYEQNVVDSCSEQGVAFQTDGALDAFDKAYAELSGAAFLEAFRALDRCRAPRGAEAAMDALRKFLDVAQG